VTETVIGVLILKAVLTLVYNTLILLLLSRHDMSRRSAEKNGGYNIFRSQKLATLGGPLIILLYQQRISVVVKALCCKPEGRRFQSR
jgi:hypothetical protein